MKLLVVPKKREKIDKYIKCGCDGLIIGLKDMSVNFDVKLTVEEISNLTKKYPNLEIFVSMNKNFYNDELERVENCLCELEKISIKGVLFYDLSILYLRNKRHLNLDLVWNQTHMVTNYNTCNYYHDLGVNYAFLSTEITLEEINEIKSKTDMKLLAFAYGYPIMAHSRRTLLTNHYVIHNQIYNNEVCTIYDDSNRFFVKEDSAGTTFLNSEFVNGTCLVTNSAVDYIVFSDELVQEDIAEKLIPLVKELFTNREERVVGQIEDLIGNNTNFFFKKTIFMVKKNDK